LIGKALAKVFGTSNEREIKRLKPLVDQINAYETQIKQLRDEQLRGKTAEFRARIKDRLQEIDAEIARLSAEMKTSPDEDIRGRWKSWPKGESRSAMKCWTRFCRKRLRSAAKAAYAP